MENACLIMGLGNPGAEYSATRHNAGFMAVDTLARQGGADWTEDRGLKASLARLDRQGRKLILGKPSTFMNLSGEAVAAVVNFYRIPTERVMVVVDDADLPLGRIRMRPGGASGGHHGLESVEQHLGTREFPRLRIGIGRRTPEHREITGHVLGRFDAGELAVVEKVLERAADQLNRWVESGIGKAMNEFNGVVNDEEST